MTKVKRVPVVGFLARGGLHAGEWWPSTEPDRVAPSVVEGLAGDLLCGLVDERFQSYLTDPFLDIGEQCTTAAPDGPSRCAPSGRVTPAQMATFLRRAAGSPVAKTSCGFVVRGAVLSTTGQVACCMSAQVITVDNEVTGPDFFAPATYRFEPEPTTKEWGESPIYTPPRRRLTRGQTPLVPRPLGLHRNNWFHSVRRRCVAAQRRTSRGTCQSAAQSQRCKGGMR